MTPQELLANPKGFQGANELQHHFCAEIGHKLRGDTGYPDDVLIAILIEKAACTA